MKKAVKIINRIVSIFLVAVLLFAGYIFVSVLRAGKDKVPDIFGYSFLQVATGSMEPTIPTNSLIIVRKTDPAAVQVGDVICFYSLDPKILGKPNTHRVVEIQQKDGELSFITKGDASSLEDTYPVSADRLVGVYLKHIQISKVMDVLHNQYFFFFVLVVPLCVIIFLEFLHVKKIAQEKAEKKNGKDSQEL